MFGFVFHVILYRSMSIYCIIYELFVFGLFMGSECTCCVVDRLFYADGQNIEFNFSWLIHLLFSY